MRDGSTGAAVIAQHKSRPSPGRARWGDNHSARVVSAKRAVGQRDPLDLGHHRAAARQASANTINVTAPEPKATLPTGDLQPASAKKLQAQSPAPRNRALHRRFGWPYRASGTAVYVRTMWHRVAGKSIVGHDATRGAHFPSTWQGGPGGRHAHLVNRDARRSRSARDNYLKGLMLAIPWYLVCGAARRLQFRGAMFSLCSLLQGRHFSPAYR